MSDGTRVTIKQVSGKEDLFRWYSQHQGVYVELGLSDGILLADYNSEVGNGMPASVYHGIDLRFPLSQVLTADGANKLLAEIAPLAQRVLDGSEVDWDGRNHVGRILTDDAQAAHDAIEALCEGINVEDNGVLEIWSTETVGDLWTAADAGVTAATTDEELRAIEKRLVEEFADGMGADLVIHGLDDHLKELRREQQELLDDEDGEDED